MSGPAQLSKKCKHFFEWHSASRLAAIGRCDARCVRSIFRQVHAPAENDFALFAASGRRTLRGFFYKYFGPDIVRAGKVYLW